ncbi:type I-E CRISPR-associated protein Cse2/CasB [Streptomyces noursei]|uniref:type I-E CRISPR-associated protein Cse2/CasB n=1 Tax=Streptomyces noursei TaxID=1971 RepID=UPI001676DD84|nr:type I-E CRISPR-associated protein Cse2/CasB [Streptomyces noursei]MCZ1021367.1 type I-E CRISPR-associated protein Cse2/CasB [Streptomyces noursei]GGX54466.1 hypothetical protein GCM10010341_89480 [Streptomyces noursei]
MAQAQAPRDPAALEAWEAANSLVYWLQRAATEDPLFLPGLRKGEHTRAAASLFSRTGQAGREEVYLGVSQLFAFYNRVPQGEQRLGFGSGSLGAALARLSWTDRIHAREGSALYLDACLRPRTRLPWRQLTKACGALRDANVAPPDWRELILDLTTWHRPRDRPEGTPTVGQRWFDDYNSAYRRHPRP